MKVNRFRRYNNGVNNLKHNEGISQKLTAPQIKHWIHVLRGGKYCFNEDVTTAFDKVFQQLRKIVPCGDDDRRELWLKAERGTIEEYDDYEELKEEGIVETYDDFENMWLEEYPDEVSWFHFVAIERKDYKAIFLGREIIYQSVVYDGHEFYGDEIEGLCIWLEDAVKSCIKELVDGVYNQKVRENLPPRERTGIILRQDYWELFPEKKASYLADISNEEKEKFIANIKEQKDDQPVGMYIAEMTANKFYQFCSLGYKANKYECLDGLSIKEQYYKMADGRDEGLSEIDLDSPYAFEEWYCNKHRFGGHPWEVCRGGNSTHIDLYVRRNEHGYYLSVRGKAWTRSIEAIKFYNALRSEGVAVYMHDAEGILNRLLGHDKIGIVPEHVIPNYCEAWFPNMEILDFMNLPYEEDDYKKMLSKVIWLEEEEQKLI